MSPEPPSIAVSLAMAYWQIDDTPQAVNWFDKVGRWMQKTARTDAELIRFRAEVEPLLRIKGQAQTETKDGPRQGTARRKTNRSESLR